MMGRGWWRGLRKEEEDGDWFEVVGGWVQKEEV